jgi:Zn-dependent peptidase ImmA (M78 family)
MSEVQEGVLVADAIRQVHAAAGLPWPSPTNGVIRPVPLDRLIATYNLVHEEVSGLSRASAGAFLARWGVQSPELLEDATPLTGFLFANARGGYILVRADDSLPRRRFTAAHELGHYLLHFLPSLKANRDPETHVMQVDGDETVREEEKETEENVLSLPEMERQANRFAAELLMPEAVCREARKKYATRFGTTSRFLEHHLASDLLVSRDAVRWRLRNLNWTNLQAQSASDGLTQ